MYFSCGGSLWYDGISTNNSSSFRGVRLGNWLGMFVWLILLNFDCLSRSMLPFLLKVIFLRFKT